MTSIPTVWRRWLRERINIDRALLRCRFAMRVSVVGSVLGRHFHGGLVLECVHVERRAGVIDNCFFVLRPARIGEPAISPFRVGERFRMRDGRLLRVEVGDVERASRSLYSYPFWYSKQTLVSLGEMLMRSRMPRVASSHSIRWKLGWPPGWGVIRKYPQPCVGGRTGRESDRRSGNCRPRCGSSCRSARFPGQGGCPPCSPSRRN